MDIEVQELVDTTAEELTEGETSEPESVPDDEEEDGEAAEPEIN